MIARIFIFLFLFATLSYGCFAKEQQKKSTIEFVVVIPSYNNEKWVIKNLQSIVRQSYRNWKIYYIDDSSSDQTGQLVDNFIEEHKIAHKCTVIHNKVRKGALANLYNAINDIAPEKVIVDLDGDDRLADPFVLEYLASIYSEKPVNDPHAVWLTYGSFKSDPPGYIPHLREFPETIMKAKTFRSYRWISSHLKTFYAKLFHLIKRDDLLWNGNFFPMASDLAIMFPMLEMASKGHIHFVKKVVHIYNVANPLQDRKVDNQLQVQLEHVIRSKRAYKAVKTLF